MVAIARAGAVMFVIGILIIWFYLYPNKDNLEGIRDFAYIIGAFTILGLFLAIIGSQRHLKKHGWR